jgi:predicted GNAT family acetyltransferase
VTSSYDDKLDSMVEETFPASDPPGNTVETGTGVGPVRATDAVHDNQSAQRLELLKEGQIAFLTYQRDGSDLVLVHTEVPPDLRGHGVGERLVRAALDTARDERRQVVALCPFAKAYLRDHGDAGQLPDSQP